MSTQRNNRDRQKQFEQKRRELRAYSRQPVGETSKEPGDIRSWPIVRAYVPVDDVFRATGFGSAGIVRQQTNGKLRYSFVNFSLLDEGITAMFGKKDTTDTEINELLKQLDTRIPAYHEGPAELAARYIWGAHSLGLKAGYVANAEWMSYLEIVPALSGNSNWWLQQLTGPGGLADQGLVGYLKRHPVPDGIPDDKEVMVRTTATFACSTPDAVMTELRRRNPEFGDDGEDEDGANCFTWTRAYPKNHWNPLSRVGRQILGSVRIYSDRIAVEAKVLSMTAILIGKLKSAFGDNIRLSNTRWQSPNDMIQEGKLR